MSQYLPPIKINELFNVIDFKYQYDYVNYYNGDLRYVKKADLKTIVNLSTSTTPNFIATTSIITY